MGRLDGKVAVITGSARGIGKQIALTFAKEGADILVEDVLVPEIEKTAQEIRDLGRKAIAVKADVSNRADVKKMIEAAIDNFKKVDILVNNAAIPSRQTLLETTDERWDRVVNVNMKGVMLTTQTVAPYMIERKYGKIVNISSIAGRGHRVLSSSSFTASKAGVIQLTMTHALELGRYGINVNCIACGPVETDFSRIGRTPEQLRAHHADLAEHSCLGRVGTKQEVANVALFLASDESSFMTAQSLTVDGGNYLYLPT
ncbi:MAG: glucose 1-dehydrogenase [Chloroflexi bacterium]|nr:glucose 1-dehydrogenase [Chloroflexota bacterium]